MESPFLSSCIFQWKLAYENILMKFEVYDRSATLWADISGAIRKVGSF